MKFRSIKVVLLLALMAMSLSPSSAANDIGFKYSKKGSLETGAQRYSVEKDSNGSMHFIYLVGRETKKMEYPLGLKVPDKDLYQMKYGEFEKDGNIKFTENVTDMMVYRFHYNMKVDSKGNVHTIFVANNYTLYYAVRDATTEQWNVQNITMSKNWLSLYPAIELGENDYPRIVYTAILMENAANYWQTFGSITSRWNLHYTYWNGSAWLTEDLTENHSGFFGKGQELQLIYNPGILIKEGMVYVAFSNQVANAAETRMSYMTFPESLNLSGSTYLSRRWERIDYASPKSTIYTRPTIIPDLEGGVYIAYGSLTKGGPVVTYYPEALGAPNPNKIDQVLNWSTVRLDVRLEAEVTTMDGIYQNGSVYLTWSLRDNFDTTKGRYSYDVFLANVIVRNGHVDEEATTVVGVTKSEGVDHYAPNIVDTGTSFQLTFIESENGDAVLFSATALPPEAPETGAPIGFLGVSVALIVLIVVWTFVIKLVPEPKKEEEILPHLINLKDSITRDE